MSESISKKTELDTFIKDSLVECFYRIFKVNVNTGKFEIYKDNGLFDDDTLNSIPDIYAFMSKLIQDNIIFPEYRTVCRRFTNPEYVRKSVFTGEKRIVQSYKARTVKGIQWVTFTIFVGHDCTPENPVVLFMWREADSDGMTLLDTLPTISSLYDKLIRINLSNNTYEPVIVDADDQERLVGGVINMYEWWAGYSKDGNIADEDIGAFSTLTRTGSLQKRFAEDPTPINFRYRRKINGEFRWVQLQLAPSVEYSDDNQVFLLSLKDVHEEYTNQLRSRQELVDTMNSDALTHLFSRLKFNEDIEKFAKSDDPLFSCLYIDVNGLHELNNILGHQKGDDMLCSVANALTKFFPNENVYRLGGDEFLVISVNLSKRDMENAVTKVRSKLLKHNYEISIGIESGACGENVEKIVAAAEQQMRNDKAAYYMRHGDRRKKRELNEELEQMLIEKRDNERFINIITNQFEGVYSVNLANDSSREICKNEFFSKIIEDADESFSTALRIYSERYVQDEYQERFNEILDFDKLDEKLRENGATEITIKNTDGVTIRIRIIEIDRQENSKPETIWIISKKDEAKPNK